MKVSYVWGPQYGSSDEGAGFRSICGDSRKSKIPALVRAREILDRKVSGGLQEDTEDIGRQNR